MWVWGKKERLERNNGLADFIFLVNNSFDRNGSQNRKDKIRSDLFLWRQGNRTERNPFRTGVAESFSRGVSVSVEQSFSGQLFGYGNVKIDVFGKWDIDTHGIVRPEELKRYLETRMIRKGEIGGTILDA